jgi:hypothetical protein
MSPDGCFCVFEVSLLQNAYKCDETIKEKNTPKIQNTNTVTIFFCCGKCTSLSSKPNLRHPFGGEGGDVLLFYGRAPSFVFFYIPCRETPKNAVGINKELSEGAAGN